MSLARLIQVADKMAASLVSAATPNKRTWNIRRVWLAPTEPETLEGDWLWVFPMHFAQAPDGTRARDRTNYHVSVAMTEALPSILRGEGDAALDEWIDRRVTAFAADVCEPYGDARRAKELWGEGFEKVIPVDPSPDMPDVLVSSHLEERRLFFCSADFVFQEG